MSEINFVIVLGASAGGLKATSEFLSVISPSVQVPIFVVIHVSRQSAGEILVDYLQKHTQYTCVLANDGDIIKNGYLYVARPDFHLLITDRNTISVIKGPHENRWRPSIDVLFRSAAAAFGSGTTGIVLTGLLDDGTAGMEAVKRSGGICIVQDPSDAEFRDMPQNVMNAIDVDYSVPIADMGYILDDILSKRTNGNTMDIPDDIRLENNITQKMISDIDELGKLGVRSDYACPDCGGSLWLMKNDTLPRYRCFTGHVYSERALLDKQDQALEGSLWISVRMLEERKHLWQTTALHHHQLGNKEQQEEKLGKVRELQTHIDRLKELINSIAQRTSERNGGFE